MSPILAARRCQESCAAAQGSVLCRTLSRSSILPAAECPAARPGGRPFLDGGALIANVLRSEHNHVMSEVTRILTQIDQGDFAAAEQLLPLVYDELRRLAAARLAHEKPGHTLQPTALVHEAYLRLVAQGVGSRESGVGEEETSDVWHSRGHFFGAAAEAMRRILVEAARRRGRVKHGAGVKRESLTEAEIAAPEASDNLLALDEALDRLGHEDPPAAELVKLRYFAGLTIPQAAAALYISPRKADFLWSFARAWLRREIEGESQKSCANGPEKSH